MKKILMALAMTGLAYFSAEAQTDNIKVCETVQNKVCRKGHDCYQTKYAENFKVCKNDRGYYICCEAPDYYNSTHPVFVVNDENRNDYIQNYTRNDYYPQNTTVTNMRSYEGYYPQKNKAKSCYVGNNVAELTHAPYKGCPSPQSDGVERNRERNVNVVTQ